MASIKNYSLDSKGITYSIKSAKELTAALGKPGYSAIDLDGNYYVKGTDNIWTNYGKKASDEPVPVEPTPIDPTQYYDTLLDGSVTEYTVPLPYVSPIFAYNSKIEKVSYPNVTSDYSLGFTALMPSSFTNCYSLNTIDLSNLTGNYISIPDYFVCDDSPYLGYWDENDNHIYISPTGEEFTSLVPLSFILNDNAKITEIGNYAFTNREFKTDFPFANVEKIGVSAFSGVTFTSSTLNIPKCGRIAEDAFSYTNISKISDASKLRSIETGAFAGTPLSGSLTLPNAQYVESGAFSYCNNLSSITLPALEEIDYSGQSTYHPFIFLSSDEPSQLQTIDLGPNFTQTYRYGTNIFSGDGAALRYIILRSPTMVTLYTASNGATAQSAVSTSLPNHDAKLYVPMDTIKDYTSCSYWNKFCGIPYSQVPTVPLELVTADNTTTGTFSYTKAKTFLNISSEEQWEAFDAPEELKEKYMNLMMEIYPTSLPWGEPETAEVTLDVGGND